MPIAYFVNSEGHGEPESCTLVPVNAAQFPAAGEPLVRVAGSVPTVTPPFTVKFPYTVGLTLSGSAAASGTFGLTAPWLSAMSSTKIVLGLAAVFSRMNTRIDCATVV